MLNQHNILCLAAMEKSKLHSAENDIFEGYDGNDNESAFDSSKEMVQGVFNPTCN